jgi:flagellar capping protein FliD
MYDKLLELATGASGSTTNSIRGLTQLGISVADGRLSLDKGVLQSRLTSDSAAVENFLATAEVGFGKKLETALKGYTNDIDGAIKGRVDALRDQVDEMDERTEFLNGRLEAKRQLLLKQFIQMEQALAQIQNQGGMLTQLAQLATQANATRRR